jgi:hypothetical protein
VVRGKYGETTSSIRWSNLGSYHDEIRRRGIRYFVTSSRIHREITNAVPMRCPSPIELAADVAIVFYSSREISESVVVVEYVETYFVLFRNLFESRVQLMNTRRPYIFPSLCRLSESSTYVRLFRFLFHPLSRLSRFMNFARACPLAGQR